MAADVQNRQTIREAYAALLVTALVGSGKPAQKVYEYIPGDFKGQSAVVAIDSAPSTRGKQAQVTRVSSGVRLDVHTLVLYGDEPTAAANSPVAGSSKVITMADTSLFEVGQSVFIEDVSYYEIAAITAVSADVSITIGTLVYSYTTPNVYWWNEKLAANRLDWLEKEISDVNMDNDTNNTWAQLSLDGDPTRDDITIGGKAYLHEVFHLMFQLHSD